MRLDWQGDRMKEQITAGLSEALVDWLLLAEQDAKGRLFRGHGEDTGSMKRGLHASPASYNFAADHAYPEGPERGGQRFTPERTEDRISAALGSGQGYAIYPHQGTRSMRALHYLTDAVENTKAVLVPTVVARMRVAGR